MLKFLQKIFKKEEKQTETVALPELNDWLSKQISNLDFQKSSKDHLVQISTISSLLSRNIITLKNQEVSEKDKEQVEARVRNIVIGHKDSYVREVSRFTETLSENTNKIDQEKSLYQEILQFNSNLNVELDSLAKRTGKSYQATQHLFFDNVEAIFNNLGELNKVVKQFEKQAQDKNIPKIAEIKTSIDLINERIETKKRLSSDIITQNNNIEKSKDMHNQEIKQLEKLKNSDENLSLLKLKKQEQELVQKEKIVDQQIFSFFAKLQKPLKKYERFALDNKIIQPYLNDSILAFKKDKDLQIIESLNGLKKNLASLQFEAKQENNFLELLNKENLEDLKNQLTNLKQKENELSSKLSKIKVGEDIEKSEKEVINLASKLRDEENKLSELKSSLEKVDIEMPKNKIKEFSLKIFQRDINIV